MLVRREMIMLKWKMLTSILIPCVFISMVVNNKEKILMNLPAERGG